MKINAARELNASTRSIPRREALGGMYLQGTRKTTGLQEKVFSREYPNKTGVDYYAIHRYTGSTSTIILELLPLDTCKDQLHIEQLVQAVARGWENYVKTI